MSTTAAVPLREESQGATVITVSVVFAVLTAIVISSRMFARLYVVQHVGLDDILMVGASLLSWAFIGATIMAVNHGLGSHIEVVLARYNITTYAQIVWFSSIFYNACLGFIKTSVLALYARLGDSSLRIMAIVMIALVACQAVANVLVCIFQCDPIPAAWDQTILNKRCVNINAFYLANAATNITTDVITYCLPWNTVRKLQVPKRQKMAVATMLGLGLFACVSSIIRITYIPQMLTSDDPTWVITGAMYWSVIEINIGILAASIPSFKSLAKRYLPRLLGSSYNSKGGPTGPSVGNTYGARSGQGFSKLSNSATAKGSFGSYGLETYSQSDIKDHGMTTTVTAMDHRDLDFELGLPVAAPGTLAGKDVTSDTFSNGGHYEGTDVRNPRPSESSEERIIKGSSSAPDPFAGGGIVVTRTTDVTSTAGASGSMSLPIQGHDSRSDSRAYKSGARDRSTSRSRDVTGGHRW